jgi:transcriptional regulator with PAS, ATPase and Fis domain
MAPRTLTNRGGRRKRGKPAVAHLIRLVDYERPWAPSSRHSLDQIDEVLVGRGERDDVSRAGCVLTLALADPRMSQRHSRLAMTSGGWVIEDLGSRNGTLVDGAKIERAPIADGALIELGRTALLWRMLEPEAPDVVATDQAAPLGELRTFSPEFHRTLANAARVAKTEQSILLHGETGTGKEVVARGVHDASGRKGPFVAVNCGALPDTLVESELFGYRKGAFSGAVDDRLGLVRAADGGTLFFDEIGDLPLATQAALLRMLQEHEVLPLGATRPVPVDVRVVAASHRDLEQEVDQGRFREDLLARLAGYVVELPAVRERREDLGILIATLLARRGSAEVIHFAPEAGAALLRYGWPRNVRELDQVLGSAIALAGDGTIELEHLPRTLHAPRASDAPVEDFSPSELERRDKLRALLAKHHGNVTAVGRELGVARMQIHRWLDKFGIDLASYRRDS